MAVSSSNGALFTKMSQPTPHASGERDDAVLGAALPTVSMPAAVVPTGSERQLVPGVAYTFDTSGASTGLVATIGAPQLGAVDEAASSNTAVGAAGAAASGVERQASGEAPSTSTPPPPAPPLPPPLVPPPPPPKRAGDETEDAALNNSLRRIRELLAEVPGMQLPTNLFEGAIQCTDGLLA